MLAAQPSSWPKFTRFRGTRKRLRFALVDQTGAPFAHEGCTLLFSLKGDLAAPDSEALVGKLSSMGGFRVVDATTIEVELLPSDDAQLTSGEAYPCDVKALNGPHDFLPEVVARGWLTLQEPVTQGEELQVPTEVVQPASPYLDAQQIEANRAAAEAAAAAALAAVGNIMVLVAEDAATATFAVGANVTVSENTEPHASVTLTFNP